MSLNHENRRQVITAAVIACLWMGMGGLIYRAIAAPVHHDPLDPNVLQQFPLQIRDWTGEDVPIGEELTDAIDADSYISRKYSRRNGLESIYLYFPCGTNAGELLQHVPENCYVGGGWTLVDRRSMELSPDGERRLTCSIVQFTRGGLDVRKLVLLHFLVVDGEYFATFSEVAKAKGWRHFAEIDYAAQVQIVASADSIPMDQATELVEDFALDAGPVLEQFFDHLKNSRGRNRSFGN